MDYIPLIVRPYSGIVNNNDIVNNSDYNDMNYCIFPSYFQVPHLFIQGDLSPFYTWWCSSSEAISIHPDDMGEKPQ